MKNLILTGALLTSLFLGAQDFNHLPTNSSDNQLLEYTQFTISFNADHKQADWVAYELTAEEVAADMDRCDCFAKDKQITTVSPVSSDYSSTGFDKGHLAPAADNNMSELANRESFLMSNMSPQLPQFNRGIWADLEAWVREQATAHDVIYVATGPVFVNNLGHISDKEITIPGYFYKTILRFEEGKPKTIAFLLPHVGAVGELKDYIVSVNTVETMTGIDFYPALENKEENRAESQISPKKWGF